MKLSNTIEFGRNLPWWPMRTLVGGPKSSGMWSVLAIWAAGTLVSVALALVEARFNWSGIPVRFGDWTLAFSFYPPLSIGVLLTLWLGPSFGATTAYLSTLASGLYGGLSFSQAAFFALGTPVELLLLWFLLLILRVRPHLPRPLDWALFSSAALVAATASSVDIMLYNAALKTGLEEGQRLWLGWVIGDFVQMSGLVAPILWLFGKQAHGYVLKAIQIPPRREISTGRILLLLTAVWATLGLIVLLGVRLLERALEIPDFAVTISGDPLVPRLREMGVFVGVFVVVLLITTIALTAALAGVSDQHKERSHRDELTGCLNRRAFKNLFDREAARSASLNLPLSVVFFDIDHFKKLNDRYGHATGDTVLAEVALRSTQILSAQELLFRWGGEEFVVLLSHTGSGEALRFAERLRARIEENISVPGPGGPEAVTISVGVATGAPPDFKEGVLVGNADAALYAAKASGRNRVMTDLMLRGAPRI